LERRIRQATATDRRDRPERGRTEGEKSTELARTLTSALSDVKAKADGLLEDEREEETGTHGK
jgi:hypothetical protein